MQLLNFLLVKRSILVIIFSIIMFSCGSYQYSGNISDGIYGENKNVAYQEETVQDDIYDDKVKNTYYQTGKSGHGVSVNNYSFKTDMHTT